MNRRFALALAPMIFMGACDLYFDVTIQTPKVEVIAAEATVSREPTGGSSPNREVNLPVCYLDNCTSENCVAEASAALATRTSEAWRAIGTSPASLRGFAENGYFVRTVASAPASQVASNWASVGCVTNGGASQARVRQCVRHMPSWVETSISEPIENLSQNQRFWSTCLRSS